MKIIERGTPPGEVVHQARCTNCRSLIEFKQSEGKVTFDGRDGNYVTILCPVCNQMIYRSI